MHDVVNKRLPLMTLAIYGHPFSSYTQKALIALWEKGLAFEFQPEVPRAGENVDPVEGVARVGHDRLILHGPVEGTEVEDDVTGEVRVGVMRRSPLG